MTNAKKENERKVERWKGGGGGDYECTISEYGGEVAAMVRHEKGGGGYMGMEAYGCMSLGVSILNIGE